MVLMNLVFSELNITTMINSLRKSSKRTCPSSLMNNSSLDGKRSSKALLHLSNSKLKTTATSDSIWKRLTLIQMTLLPLWHQSAMLTFHATTLHLPIFHAGWKEMTIPPTTTSTSMVTTPSNLLSRMLTRWTIGEPVTSEKLVKSMPWDGAFSAAETHETFLIWTNKNLNQFRLTT